MARTKLWNFWTNIQGLNWKQIEEVTKTGAGAAKAVFDLAKAVQTQQSNVQNLKPYIEEISSLLDVFNTPLGQIIKEVIPFPPIAITILKLIFEATKKEPSLEICVILVSQVAYIESFKEILKQDSQLLEKIDKDKAASDNLANQIKQVGKEEFEDRETKKAIVYFHESKLAEVFNQILHKRLQEAGLTETEAKTVTEKVARKTNEHMASTLANLGDKVKQLVHWYSAGGEDKLEKRLSIEDYLENKIKPNPEDKIFDEKDITFRDLYVPLQVKELDDQNNTSIQVEDWVKAVLNNPNTNKQKQVLFIQGEAGRGKSVFCRMFADWVRRELHPSFTPILIRLRELRVLKDNLTETLKAYLQNLDFVQRDSGWLTDKNTRFLFLLDGFDELLLEGRASGGLQEFLSQVEQFQKDIQCHHQFLVTGRPLALQGIDRLLSQTNSIKRAELQPMDDSIRQTWLKKWEAKVGPQEATNFEQFLQACPDEIKNNLAREPLLLYLLGRMHREQRLNVQMFADAKEDIQAKIRIYDAAVKWVLEEQRKSENQNDNSRLTKLESEDLREFLTEAALCVVQSGNESAKVAMLKARLEKSESPAAKLFKEPKGENSSDKNQQEKLLNNLLTAFYIQPGSGDKDGSVEFVHKSFGEFLFAERLIKSFVVWTTKVLNGKREEDRISTKEMDGQIYDLLGYGNLTLEIVEYLMGLLTERSEFNDIERLQKLFQRLEYFYFRWCDGEFIDAEDMNLPQMTKNNLREQLPERKTHLGLRQVDVYTGLNVMILLLELHRYAQSEDKLKEKITFHPCRKSDSDEFDSQRLLRILGYSHSLSVSAFNKNLGLFLRGVNLSNADLSNADLSNADLSNADLSNVDLSGVDFFFADLSNAKLSTTKLNRTSLFHANLSNADLSNADLSNAYLSNAKLSSAILSNADLSNADLFDAELRSAILRSAKLSNADLRVADLRGADLKHAKLSHADLFDAKLSNADLSHAYLHNANLHKVNLSSANLSHAYLSHAYLFNADLSDANLSNAYLDNAYLSRANFSGANLTNANLTNANLEEVVWNSDTKWLTARGLHKAVGISPELGQDSAFAAAVALSQGISWVKEGKMEEAKNAFRQARTIQPSLDNSAEYWNSICWVGCLHGYAKNVFFIHKPSICEKAVALDPDNKRYQDSRGLAKVLTGDLVGALEDFQAAVDSGALDYSDYVKQRRLRWIEALKSGNNPLTPDELEKLRQAEG